MKSLAALSIFLCVASPAWSQVSGGAVDYARRRAARLLDEQNYVYAETYISEQRRRFPKDAALAIYQGECRFALERYEGAVRAFAEGIALDETLLPRVPNYPFALVKLGRLSEARALYARIGRLATNDIQRAQGAYGLALCARHAGDLAAAEQEARLAVRLDPKSRKSRYLLARLLRRKGPEGAREAVVHLQSVIELDPLHAGALGQLAQTYAQLGDFAAARTWQERHRQAVRTLEEARELRSRLAEGGRDPSLLVRLANLWFENRRYADAAGPYAAAIATDPKNAELRYRFAVCRYHLGDPSGARKQLEQVLRLSPDHAAARRLHTEIVERFMKEGSAR